MSSYSEVAWSKLDRWITGNYGEDQYQFQSERDLEEPEEEMVEVQAHRVYNSLTQTMTVEINGELWPELLPFMTRDHVSVEVHSKEVIMGYANGRFCNLIRPHKAIEAALISTYLYP